jgi:hypothetical protein
LPFLPLFRYRAYGSFPILHGSAYQAQCSLLAALAENTVDIQEESALLRQKTAALGDLNSVSLNSVGSEMTEWLEKGTKACGVDPAFYIHMGKPHLYSFEEQDEEHDYAQRMKNAAEKLNLGDWFSYLSGERVLADALPPDAVPIDLAWNDAHHYKEFFEAFWPALNPKGGLMIFHNTVSRKYNWDAIQWMKAKRSLAKDMEVITLPEIHKLDQNSCTILRRTTQYQPPCLTRYPEEILHDAREFMKTQG